jgi:hypothetical protein
MACNPLVEPACHAAGTILGTASLSGINLILKGLAAAVRVSVQWIVENTATWWIRLPSPNLAANPATSRIQQLLLPAAVAIAIGGIIAAGIRMVITRKANPLLDVAGGLLTITLATTLGATIATILLKAGDAWSSWVLNVSTGGQFTQRLTEILNVNQVVVPIVAAIFGVLAIVLSLVQAMLMLFRQAALLVLIATLPLAAAGSMSKMTRPWIRKVTAWMLALIFYKPAAAAVYATAFTMAGSGGVRNLLTGFAMLAMSVVALPVLMKFFTWTTGSVGSSGGGGQLLSSAAVGAVAVGAMRSSQGGSGSAAQDQAAYLSSRLGPPPSGGGDAGAPGGAPPAGSPPAGPAGSAAAGGSPGPGAAAGAPPAAGTGPAEGTGTPPPGAAAAAGSGTGGPVAGGSAAGAAASAATQAGVQVAGLPADAMTEGNQR